TRLVSDWSSDVCSSDLSLPGLLQSLFGYNALNAGLVMSPSGFFALLAMPVVGFILGRKTDARWLIGAGLLLMAISNYWMSQLNHEYDLLPQTLEPSITHGRPLIDSFYYEIITFTTVGCGDIIPSTAQGKLLAICTALLGATHGVTFVAIILQALTQHPSAKDQG